MVIRELQITNFRGIESMRWRPTSALSCVVGAGDAGKSTLLEAIEATLSTRWASFTDADFTNGDIARAIEISATIGELPAAALADNRMGLNLRGWSADGDLHDEPIGDDEAVLTIRLSVDASLEPVWALITDRAEPRILSSRDRALFGVARLGAEVDRHLAWGQGSALSRLTTQKETTGPLLADAYRKAREALSDGALPTLTDVAQQVRAESRRLGAYVGDAYSAGLDATRGSISLAALALHSDGVPVRLAGLGSRRLVALAAQYLSISEGAILLIDEVEHGLEPHRIRHALSVLRDLVLGTEKTQAGRGQVILTTHSSTSIVELACEQLVIAHRTKGELQLRQPAALLQSTVRRVPEAFLARRLIVCEGKTEVGLLRAQRAAWAKRHGGEPIEACGVALVDGNGTEAPNTAIALAQLGYSVALLRDDDVPLTAAERTAIFECKIDLFQWTEKMATEERVLADIGDEAVQLVLDSVFEMHSIQSVLDSIRGRLGATASLFPKFRQWSVPGKDSRELRAAIAAVAKKQNWFKQIELGERLGAIVAVEIAAQPSTPLADVISAVEKWAYA